MKVFDYNIIDSTFTEAGCMAPQLGEGQYLFLAVGQSLGRGQGDHSFLSPAGNGIYATLLVKDCNISPGHARLLTPLSAVCATEVLGKVTGFGDRLSVKWVNDLLIDGYKYGGILSGARTEKGRITSFRIGFGINTGNADISGMIGQKVSSLNLRDGTDIRSIAIDIAELIVSESLNADADRIFHKYEKICRMEGKKVILPDGSICRCESIDSDFSLLVRDENGSAHRISGTTGLIFV
ncbi:MAG: hypothetical protein MJ102_01550 [Clostridia bacterium]|nr:hypothetical protein [Clostridia bacterium]